jgi:hypothetical protein|tara:strand:+ start:4063 stop:5427 length:1365 start_codon:yes stop_codon:yes gene_type:complete
MASSYTTSFGIEKIGSGEQSGAWGDTTNHNIDILDRIASYKAVALSGTTHTLTVREASPGSGTENLQDGMYRVIKFTGALGGNNTVTVAPNTTAAFFIIINATTDSASSGPYSVILTQGSGANITVTNGKSAVVYMDGAGGGAAVINALSDLEIATLTTSGDITVSGTLNALGDTAASDAAAIGYTSAEGLILTGQGSTNDVTIKNDADADVLEIPTGTVNVTVAGDLTSAGTLNVTGDTATGDDAAIGYTAAEGLILTGQGSTNDVTIKNDADADVLEIPTGTTNVSIVGSATVASLELGHASDTSITRVSAGVIAVEGTTILDTADIGVSVQAYDADTLKADVADELTAGFSAAAHSAGTKSSGTYTPDVDDGNFQHAINGGAHTLAVPAKNCTMVILYKNNASAGTITTSGYTVTDGDSLTTTNGHEFFFYITRINDGSTTFSMLTVKALQ